MSSQTMSNRKSQKGTLQKRLALFLLILLTGIVVITLTVVWRSTFNHLTEQLNSQFKTATAVVEDRIFNLAEFLESNLEPVAKDFTTKQLISSARKDPTSLSAAMDNYQENRWGTDVYWVLDAELQPLVSSQGTAPISQEIILNLANDGAHWYQSGGVFYLMRAVPVRFVELSGQINAWIVAGIRADKLFDGKLVALTDMQVSLFHFDSKKVIASTFDDVKVDSFDVSNNIKDAKINDRVYLYVTSPLGDWIESPVMLVMAKNEAKAYLSSQMLIKELFAILILAGVLAWIAAVIVSRGITGPLIKLIDIARNISKGTYIENFPSSNAREVQTLSLAISDMQHGIVEREKAINELAFFDELTGLPNRLQFNQHIENHIDEMPDCRLIVATLDIDRFKEINDTVGHEIGDQLLQLVSRRLASFSDNRPFFARLSGDEFGIVFSQAGQEHVEPLAKSVVCLFEQPFAINDLVLDIDCSVGVAVYPDNAKTHQGLLQCADIAMYSCKEQHYRYAIYEPSLNRYSVMRLSLMSELKGALGDGQLQLHYQPKVSLATDRVETVECLIRWIHPEHGFVSPDEFIPLAEQTGAIRYVTNWALKQTCKTLCEWREKGIILGAAVNISAMDLVDMRLPTYIAQLLTEYNLSPDVLTLEVTESAVMSDPDSAFKALNILKTMGITLSIDDFGTGYSSMAQLKKMPVHELKIDKTFVLDLAKNKDDQIMVKTLVSLASNLSLKTVAEGVEDAETLSLLKQFNCTKAQGFYMSKALPAEDFEIWLETYMNQGLAS